jgi:hypothetical protein
LFVLPVTGMESYPGFTEPLHESNRHCFNHLEQELLQQLIPSLNSLVPCRGVFLLNQIPEKISFELLFKFGNDYPADRINFTQQNLG